MTATTRRLVSAAAAAVLVLGLAACGDSTEEDPSPSPTQPPASDGSGAVASDGGGDAAAGGEGEASDGGGEGVQTAVSDAEFPPPDPAYYPGLNTNTEQGAEQTAKYFWDVFGWSSEIGSTDELKHLSSTSCSTCQDLIGSAQKNYRENTLSRPIVIFEKTNEALGPGEGHDQLVHFTFRQEINYADGDIGEQNVEALMGLSWVGDHWEVEDIAYETEKA